MNGFDICGIGGQAAPDDAREFLNCGAAFDLVSECLETAGAISEGLVRQIHTA